MTRSRRLAAIVLVALALAPGTFVRTDVTERPARNITFSRLSVPEPDEEGPLRVLGLWQVDGDGQVFGGFSALLRLGSGCMRAFSDRTWRFTFAVPGGPPCDLSDTARMSPDPEVANHFFDAEAATRNPRTGDYWVTFENSHGIQRFTDASHGNGSRLLAPEVNWPQNAGLEALVRLPDGRFIAFQEGADEGLIFAGDPVEGAGMESFPVDWPVAGYSATDATLLPDGRMLVLMRGIDLSAWPPFSTIMLIGDTAALEPGEQWRPELLARLDDLLPRENYEGIAVIDRPAGGSEIWLISDDNFSAFQRTLLARLALPDARRASR